MVPFPLNIITITERSKCIKLKIISLIEIRLEINPSSKDTKSVSKA